MGTALALSIHDRCQQDKELLSRPITTLTRMAGLTVNDVYSVLLPELAGRNLGEAIRFAEVGLKYAVMIDRNRLREEVGEQFVLALDLIISLVKDGLASSDKWIKRKAISLHSTLIDEASERKRFVESVLADNKFEMVAVSLGNLEKLEAEILDFERNDNGDFALNAMRAIQ